MRRFILSMLTLFAWFACACFTQAFAQESDVQSDVSKSNLAVELTADHIDVTSGFAGDSIELFGYRKDPDTDIVVVVFGPEKQVTVWEKAQVMGAWINRYYVHFQSVPMYYNYGLSNLTLVSDYPDLAALYKIGIEPLLDKKNIEKSGSIKDIKPFEDILIKRKQALQIFPQDPVKITFINDYFFRVGFHIPSSAPTGEYKIFSYQIKNGKVMYNDMSTLRIEQIGINAFILQTARESSLLYGLATVVFAILLGWFVSMIRVRT